MLAETGEVFDTTHEDNTVFSFELGKGSVISAWDIALRTMKVFFISRVFNSVNSSIMSCPLMYFIFFIFVRLARLQESLVSLNMRMELLVLHLIFHQSRESSSLFSYQC